jgi:hypothetical protein
MGVGQRGLSLSTRLSSRATVREVTAADADVGSVVETLDTRVPEGVGEVPRGDHATLVLYVVLGGGVTAATIQLFGRCNDEVESSSSSPTSEDEWCFYDDWTADAKNLMVVLPDMPASEYKVVVSAITGSGAVAIREQHSA